MNNWELEIFKTVLVLVVLAATWFIGQRIIAYWDRKKKRQELDLESAKQFYQLYGEFKAVMRLWKVYYRMGDEELGAKPDLRADLLKRAAAAEGGVESIMVKLASERVLDCEEIETIGLFRQAFQELRIAIRDKVDLEKEWSYKSARYQLFNNLASRIAWMIASANSPKRPDAKVALENLSRITAIRDESWKDKVE